VRAAAATGSLLFGEKYAALLSAVGCGGHGDGIGGSDFVEMMKMRIEDRASHQWPHNFRQ